MPNYVTTVLTVTGDQSLRNAMFEAIKDDQLGIGSVDFNKIIPMPENIFQGNLGEEERKKYGKNNWYDWSVKNWGTKWNCLCDDGSQLQPINPESDQVSFQTAWNFPDPAITALAAKYPNLRFEAKWADENFGHNVGIALYEKGKLISVDMPDGGSSEAIALATEILGEDYSD